MILHRSPLPIGDQKKMLFEPFQQAERKTGGTGIGLYALQQRMDALGGTCEVLDRDDGCQGSVFGFSFPYRPDPQKNGPQFIVSQKSDVRFNMIDPDSSESEIDEDDDLNVSSKGYVRDPLKVRSSLLPTTTSIPPLRILVVDDSPSIVKVTKRFLTEHGHEVDTAENGSEALEKLKKMQSEGADNSSFYDMMLTDIQMPVMGGLECTKRYRQWANEGAMAIAPSSALSEGAKSEKSEGPTMKRLLIMGMSANSDEEVVREALAIGMDAFIGKVWTFFHHRFYLTCTSFLSLDKSHLIFLLPHFFIASFFVCITALQL